MFPVLGSQPAGDVSHKPGGRLPLLSARPTGPQSVINGQSAVLCQTDGYLLGHKQLPLGR